MKSNYQIDNLTVANAIVKTRVVQCTTIITQGFLKKKVLESYDALSPTEQESFVEKLIKNMKLYQGIHTDINNHLPKAEEVGYPIKCNKLPQQLGTAISWAEGNPEGLMAKIKNGQFCHGLTNELSPQALPELRSSPDTEYWGNNTHTASTVLLFCMLKTLGSKLPELPGAMTYYPFYNTQTDFGTMKISVDWKASPFIDQNGKGMNLCGEFQFGGHRYLLNREEYFKQSPYLTGNSSLVLPDDASSFVGLCTGLTKEQLTTVRTGIMRPGTEDSKLVELGYTWVTSCQASVTEPSSSITIELKKARPGDILLMGNFSAIITTVDPEKFTINTIQCNRDLDATPPFEGIGTYSYDIQAKLEELQKKLETNPNTDTNIYILHPKFNDTAVRDDLTFENLLRHVNKKYQSLCYDNEVENLGAVEDLTFNDFTDGLLE